MPASFTYAAVYLAEAVCQTPLRTGGTDGNPEQILRDRDGTAFLQGASLAGALRGWLQTSQDQSAVSSLFGSQNGGGHLIVSDAVFDPESEQTIRPRLRIDPKTAAGDPGGKFDMAHINAGAVLHFSLTWLGFPADAKQELSLVEQMLAALDAGDILLGAQKTNGFGRLSLFVKKRVFDLTDAGDRKCWLADEREGMLLTLPKPKQRQGVLFTVQGRTSNLLVKTAPAQYKNDQGKFRSYTPNLSESGQALLPGSSIKGPVLARANYIARFLSLDSGFVDHCFGRQAAAGDNGLPGLVRFEDAALTGQKKKISRVRIDRFTGGVFQGGLFTEEPVCSDLALRIAAADEPALCSLLLYALRDLGLGLYSLGSGWAIGRGQIDVQVIQAESPDGRKAVLRFDGQGNIAQEDPSGLFQAWREGLEAQRV